jgi:GT2 family glycosyltransferase
MQLITTILNVYKRPEYLLEQAKAIKEQTVSSDIWIDYTVPKGQNILDLHYIIPEAKISIRTNQNLYHYGRFYYGLNTTTDYIFICDDDIIPGTRYLEYCIETIEKYGDCVVTGYGLKFDRKNQGYKPVSRYGWHTLAESGQKDYQEVDMGGHSWFMKKDTLNLIARERPLNNTNAEDLHFSFMINKYSNIPIIVPPHLPSQPENWSCDYNKGFLMGNDDNATFRRHDHDQIRSQAVDFYLQNGWKFVNDR